MYTEDNAWKKDLNKVTESQNFTSGEGEPYKLPELEEKCPMQTIQDLMTLDISMTSSQVQGNGAELSESQEELSVLAE